VAAKIVYSDIQAYLEAIANNPNDERSVDDSNHQRFWKKPYDQFIHDSVPNEDCNGAPIPIVNKDPNQCPFYQALVNKTGWCSKQQMPRKGPFITDQDYTVKLANGASIKGSEIDANIIWWLTHEMPEK
jgi:hypothetical protein